jgi:hypothetical protein
MAEKPGKWSSNCGPISRITLSVGCKGGTVPLAVGSWYKFHSVAVIWGMSVYRFIYRPKIRPEKLHRYQTPAEAFIENLRIALEM